jgi:hypothetical protein
VLVEVLTPLQQHDQLLTEATHGLRVRAVNVDLVSAGDNGRVGEGGFDQA